MWITQALLVMVLWAACFPLIGLGLQDAPHLYFAGLRALLAGIALLLVGMALGRPVPRGVMNWAQLTGIGIGATTLAFLGMFHASEFISPGLATVIANTQPILATAVGYLLLGERPGWAGHTGMALGFAGILLIALPGGDALSGGGYALGLAYLLLATLGVTFSNVLIRRVAGAVDIVMAMAIQLLIGAVPLLLAAAMLEQADDISWTGRFVFSLLTLGLAGTALAYWLWCRVLAVTELYRANVFTYLVPGLGLAMGALFYDERVSMMTVFGVLLTLAAMSLVSTKAGAR